MFATAYHHIPGTRNYAPKCQISVRSGSKINPRNTNVTGNIPNTSHKALLVGGGSSGRTVTRLFKKNLPLRAEYKDLEAMERTFEKSQKFKNEDIQILFGNGSIQTEVQVWESFKKKFQHCIYKGFPNNRKLKPHDHLTGAATLANIEKAFDSFSKNIKGDDTLWIVVSGHGGRFIGTILWNEYCSIETLKVSKLADQLKKINPQSTAYIIVDSCYSGHFLPLTSKNIIVLSSSNSAKESLFFDGKGSQAIEVLSRQLASTDKSLLRIHAEGSIAQKNYYAMDSLSFYLKKQFEEDLGRSISRDLYEKMMQRVYGSYLIKLSLELSFVSLIVFDPTGFFRLYANSKLGLALGKSSIVFAKTAAYYLFKKQYEQIEKKIEKTQWYKEKFVRKDKWEIAKLQDIIKNMKDFNSVVFTEEHIRLRKERIKVLDDKAKDIKLILDDLEKLKKEVETDGRISPYYYLKDKAKLFLSYANAQQIDEFIAIAKKMTFNPLKPGT